MELNNLIYLPKLAKSNNEKQFFLIDTKKDELIIQYLKLFDSYDQIKLYHVDNFQSTGPELKNLIIHFYPVKGEFLKIYDPFDEKDNRKPRLRLFDSKNTNTLNFEEEKNKIDLERFTPKIHDGYLVNSNNIENYIVKDIYINEDKNNSYYENIEDYLEYVPNIENGSILFIIRNNMKRIYSFEEHRDLHKKCDYFYKFTDISNYVTDNIECQTKLFKVDNNYMTYSGPFLKYTINNKDYHNKIEFYNNLTIEELIESIKSNWYLKYADDYIKRYDLIEKDNLYLDSLSLEDRDSEIKRRKDQKEQELYDLEIFYEEQRKEENENQNRWESTNSSFYDATDGQLGELGEEGWTSIGRD